MSVEREASLERALSHWRHSRTGFAPLYCEPILTDALAYLFDGLDPGGCVLDLGAGAGQVSAALGAAGLRALAVDVDAAFCFSVLQYTERGPALAELRRVLRPGGRFVVIENLAEAGRRLRAAFHRVDRFVLDRWDGARGAAWLALVKGRR